MGVWNMRKILTDALALHQVHISGLEILLPAAQHYPVALGKPGLLIRSRTADIAAANRVHLEHQEHHTEKL